jgi:hypothetical protein
MAARRGLAGLCFAAMLTLGPDAHAQTAAAPVVPGTTIDTAIVLPHITDEFHGVVAEHTYIADHFPTWHLEYQTTIDQNDRRYDLIGMLRPDRTTVPLYFDITEWAGK